MHTYMSIHAYIHVCIHAYIHVCIHAYMHVCTHAYMQNMQTCRHADVHRKSMHAQISRIRTHLHSQETGSRDGHNHKCVLMMTQAFVESRLCLCARTRAPIQRCPRYRLNTPLTSTQEIAVIENIFKLRSAQPSRIVTEMRSSLIDAMQS